MSMIDMLLSVFLLASVIFLVYELRRFGSLHSKKYELPTEKIWEKFVGIRPEDLSLSSLIHLESRIKELDDKLEAQKKLTKKLIEELGK